MLYAPCCHKTNLTNCMTSKAHFSCYNIVFSVANNTEKNLSQKDKTTQDLNLENPKFNSSNIQDYKWTRKSLLSTQDLSLNEVDTILNTAKNLCEIITRPVKKVPSLRGKVIMNLFYENSTRTRTSFELAGKYLSADVINFSVATSSVKKGETIQDTAETLIQMGTDLVVIRHAHSGTPFQLAKHLPSHISLINAGDGSNEHPSQALLDLYTIKNEAFTDVKNKKIVILGDVLNSRVARSNIWLLKNQGADIHLCGPSTLVPTSFEKYGVHVIHNLKTALKDADIIMALRLQTERQASGNIPSLEEYHKLFGLDHEKIKLAKENVKILHPGPMNRGVEITSQLADDKKYSLISNQVSNGVAIRMALLYLLVFA